MIVRPTILEMSCSNERMAGLGEKAVCAPRPVLVPSDMTGDEAQQALDGFPVHENPLPSSARTSGRYCKVWCRSHFFIGFGFAFKSLTLFTLFILSLNPKSYCRFENINVYIV